MKTKKKNRFLTFCFSMMPGAAEMYMGFMRTGTELMLLFLGMIMIPSFIGLDGLAILAVVVWAYGFFHANHLASLSDEEFEKVEDDDIFGMELFRKGKKKIQGNSRAIAVLLIILGIWLLWRTGIDMLWHYRVLPEYIYELLFTINDYLPRAVASILVIVLGVHMIRGKKEELYREESFGNETQESQEQYRAQEAADQSAASENPDREGKK